jgi:hypothetical protein
VYFAQTEYIDAIQFNLDNAIFGVQKTLKNPYGSLNPNKSYHPNFGRVENEK